ncbi:MAG: hypothetical protein EG826_17845 [Deltaproteobacteria bacterium]|nr:hypothetical protein [Deltaproteobacteria bacterium]
MDFMSFRTQSTCDHEDGSSSFSLFATTEEGKLLIWDAPSYASCKAAEEALLAVISRFQNCKSDREATQLAHAVDVALFNFDH